MTGFGPKYTGQKLHPPQTIVRVKGERSAKKKDQVETTHAKPKHSKSAHAVATELPVKNAGVKATKAKISCSNRVLPEGTTAVLASLEQEPTTSQATV